MAVNSGGRLVPFANATGTLTVGALSLNTNSTTDFEFGAGPANDVIIVSNAGGLSFGSAFTLNFYDVDALTPFSTNGIYTLLRLQRELHRQPVESRRRQPSGRQGLRADQRCGTTSIRLTISDRHPFRVER